MSVRDKMKKFGYGLLFLAMPFSPSIAVMLAALDSEAERLKEKK